MADKFCSYCGTQLPSESGFCPGCGARVESAAPVQPAVPVQPVAPEQPVIPVQPVQPVQPVAPEQPVIPVQPVQPVQPVAPVQPVMPQQPVQPEQPVQPVQPVAPVQPVMPQQPVQPMQQPVMYSEPFQAPVYQAPAAPAKKKSNVGLIVGICVAVLAVIVGIILAVVLMGDSSSGSRSGDDEDERKVKKVTLSQSALTLEREETATLEYELSPSDAEAEKVQWSSSDESVATVEDGEVTAVGTGTCEITVKVDGKSAVCTVTVPALSEERMVMGEWAISEIYSDSWSDADWGWTFTFNENLTGSSVVGDSYDTFTWRYTRTDDDGDPWFQITFPEGGTLNFCYVKNYGEVWLMVDGSIWALVED